jgi:hypothetical protein
MATNLSKAWTLDGVLGIIKQISDAESPDKIRELTLIDIIHLAVCDVAERLNGAKFPDYITSQTVTQSNNVISLASYNVASITKLVDATNGLCIEVSLKEIEKFMYPQDANTIYYAIGGENIYLAKGIATLTYGTLTLYYNREPLKVTAKTDTMDVRDRYIKLVIDTAKLTVYELLGKTAPQDVTNSVQAIRDSILAEKKLVKE